MQVINMQQMFALYYLCLLYFIISPLQLLLKVLQKNKLLKNIQFQPIITLN